jgi:hypothetical protein
MRRARHLGEAIASLLAMSLLAGCLMDATINDKGGGTMTIKYRLSSEAQFSGAKRRVQSRYVTLTDAKIEPDKWATFDLKFDDVTKLSTIEYFDHTTFALTPGPDGTKTLTATFTNANPSKLPEEMVAYFGREAVITIHLPGEVVKSNATKTDGRTVIWTYPLAEFTSAPTINVTVTYKSPAPPP